jgi:ubiquinone biosynthesis O-methyltransferase
MNYLNYTNVEEDIGGLKRLNFVINEINKKFQKNKKTTILDFGCGVGPISFPLACLGYNIYGLDIDQKSIDLANKKNKFKNIKFEKKNIKDITKLFDVIISTQVLEHIKNPEHILIELSKKLKKEGIMIITIPNGFGFSEFLKRIKQALKIKNGICDTNQGKFTANQDTHVNFFSLRRFYKIAQISGLKIKKIKNHTFLLGIFPFSYLFFLMPKVISKKLDKIDSYMADLLPHFSVNGWYFILEKK